MFHVWNLKPSLYYHNTLSNIQMLMTVYHLPTCTPQNQEDTSVISVQNQPDMN